MRSPRAPGTTAGHGVCRPCLRPRQHQAVEPLAVCTSGSLTSGPKDDAEAPKATGRVGAVSRAGQGGRPGPLGPGPRDIAGRPQPAPAAPPATTRWSRSPPCCSDQAGGEARSPTNRRQPAELSGPEDWCASIGTLPAAISGLAQQPDGRGGTSPVWRVPLQRNDSGRYGPENRLGYGGEDRIQEGAW